MNARGFTLVELAIVITIIGLLIGGVLKGQELLDNARMTSGAAQLKSYAAAVTTFKDVYKAYPGDMASPSNFLQNCTTAPCNESGNNDGLIGPLDSWVSSNENTNFWLHLAKANLVSGVDPNSTATFFNPGSPQPNFAMGGIVGVIYFQATGWIWTADNASHYFTLFNRAGGTTSTNSLTLKQISKYDLKVDDGKPKTGDVIVGANYAMATNVYDPNTSDMAYMFVKTGFK